MRLNRLRSLYNEALECEPSRRAALLSEHASDDPALIEEVLNLLELQEAASGFLDKPLTPGGIRALIGPAGGPPLLEAGTLVAGRFHVIRLIGRGGMGEVYEARTEANGARVALKIVRTDFLDDPDHQRRLRKEATLASRIEPHPNICRMFETVTHIENGVEFPVLVMELLDGPTLAAWIKQKAPLPFQEAELLARQLASALAAAHRAGVVHRISSPRTSSLSKTLANRRVPWSLISGSRHQPHPRRLPNNPYRV